MESNGETKGATSYDLARLDNGKPAPAVRYLGHEVGLHGEQLVGLLLHQAQVGDDVAVSDAAGGPQHVLDDRAVAFQFLEQAAHPCGTEGRGSYRESYGSACLSQGSGSPALPSLCRV